MHRFRRAEVLRFGVLAGLLSSAFASYQIQLADFNNGALQRVTRSFESIRIEYCLLSTPKESAVGFSAKRYSAHVSATAPLKSAGLLTGNLQGQLQGECYRAKVRLSPGFEASKIFFVAKVLDKPRLAIASNGSPLGLIRFKFLKALSGVTTDSAGLVAGLSIGDTSSISNGLLCDFKVTSLTHLTAVSGTNCAIVLGLVWLISARLRFGRHVLTRWPKLILAALALFGYVSLVGNQPSVLRAGFMAMAVLLAKTLGRGSSALNALLIACLGLLNFDPWLLFDYGFWLSALACVGILMVAPWLAKVLGSRFEWAPKWLVLAIAVSVSAQILCFPILLMLQPGFSTYSVVANLLCEPLVAPVTVLGLIAVVCSAFSPMLAAFVSFAASLFAVPICAVAHYFAHLPAATGFWPSGTLGQLLAFALALAAVGVTAKRFRGMAVLSIASVLFVVVAAAITQGIRSQSWITKDWFITSCDVGQGDATVIRSQGKVALIDVGRDPAMIDTCLKQLHISHIDFLELTHFDLDHVAGLAGALAGRQVASAMLTPFVDTRPGADDARELLEAHQIPVAFAETGLTGVLGDFHWQVLSPHAGASEAQDSNDGSITMLWRSSAVDIITLADLGERGQQRLIDESGEWMNAQLSQVALVIKVSHHGSADQSAQLITKLHPQIALVSVGKGNSYGHPTARTLKLLRDVGSSIERTDEHGSISLALNDGGFRLGFQGEQGKTG